MSHPVRVRGLKSVSRDRERLYHVSHPVRVRGLKLSDLLVRRCHLVAPRAGAWIEINLVRGCLPLPESHPVRVRGLKYPNIPVEPSTTKSHPVRVRGLKYQTFRIDHQSIAVAPRAGAWIEIPFPPTPKSPKLTSHPVRVRGLKSSGNCPSSADIPSHPVRVRGLKFNDHLVSIIVKSRTPCGCVD